MKITSCGIIKNEDKPRVGVISQHSIDCDMFSDLFYHAIDLDFETALHDIEKEVIRELDGCHEDEIDHEIERRTQELADSCFESHNYLIGDWKKDDNGKYSVNKNGENGFSASYNSETGNICVEWSKTTKRCHHTSPCYVMADGSGPCGDLDTSGDSVISYSLPDEYLRKEKI